MTKGPTSKTPTWLYVLGSFFFSGSAPRLRGTIGTVIPAIVIAMIEVSLAPPWWWTLVAAAAVLAIGIPVGNAVSTEDDPDPPWFVLDELLGMLLTVTAIIPLTGAEPTLVVAVAFVVFRLIDMKKPPPIRQVELRVRGGWGIMLDDILAAVYAWPIVWFLVGLIHSM